MEIYFNDYVISDDKKLLDISTIKEFLAKSYWANKRAEERIERSIENSLCYGVYHGNRQIGFARVVTDHATMYWLCDVFVDEEYRGHGIGKKLVESLTASEELKNLMGLLGTRDAHELYKQYGFEEDKDRFMRRARDYIRKNESLS
jgi:GNAT superfamily N-acetyltransferase